MSSRRKARETILRALYLSESRGITIETAFGEMEFVDNEMESQSNEVDTLSLKPFSLGLDEKQKEFALLLARRIEQRKAALNEQIRSVLENWDLSRISRIDRYIMWIALAEMSFIIDIPPLVSINEAVELARKFSSHKSPSFVNGILDKIAHNMGVITKPKSSK